MNDFAAMLILAAILIVLLVIEALIRKPRSASDRSYSSWVNDLAGSTGFGASNDSDAFSHHYSGHHHAGHHPGGHHHSSGYHGGGSHSSGGEGHGGGCGGHH